MLLEDVLKEFLFEIKIRNYTAKTQKGRKATYINCTRSTFQNRTYFS